MTSSLTPPQIANLYLSFDISDVSVNEDDKLVHTPQLDFSHEIIYALNRTSLWQFGKIHVFLEAENMTIEVSPALSVPSSLKEFRHLIKDLIMGREVKSGNISLLKIRTDKLKLPKTRFTVDPYANKVVDPNSLTEDGIMLCLSLNPESGTNTHACFSKSPLPALNQCLNVAAAIERRGEIA
ncbi:hypothetical protein TRFO_36843 [Tritrichomonas foetus]|uniref:Uncharacterized protein n=1 Tax=Tritrichomonas foetus TaxID=1144522 RepID=A0A1J4JHC8_9EUKA|nr:hypothetical protein TRFO_36843 [Tritrichomonas foetus]|eukprot:OHS97011.1 hypothetical protein TRFO_36843 [Tritrichomonas foetus]